MLNILLKKDLIPLWINMAATSVTTATFCKTIQIDINEIKILT